MLVCDAREEDLPAIEALEQRCFSIPWTREMLLYQLTDPGHFFLAARDGDTVAGYIGVQHVLDEGYVTNVCTAPEYRRRGVGRAQLEAALARARQLELSFLSLEVRDGNVPARGLYEAMGFHAVGRRKNYYEKPVEDAIIMTVQMK